LGSPGSNQLQAVAHTVIFLDDVCNGREDRFVSLSVGTGGLALLQGLSPSEDLPNLDAMGPHKPLGGDDGGRRVIRAIQRFKSLDMAIAAKQIAQYLVMSRPPAMSDLGFEMLPTIIRISQRESLFQSEHSAIR
jgi:hypothetical protein